MQLALGSLKNLATLFPCHPSLICAPTLSTCNFFHEWLPFCFFMRLYIRIKWYWSFRPFNLFLSVTPSHSDSVMLPLCFVIFLPRSISMGSSMFIFADTLPKTVSAYPFYCVVSVLILLRDLPFYASVDGEVTWGSGRPCQKRARASSPGGVVCFRFLVARSDVTTPSFWAGGDELAGATGPFHYLHALF